MGAWDLYESRMVSAGETKRGAALRRELHNISTMLDDNLSYCSVEIDNEKQNVAVINTDNLNEKFIISMPGEDIKHGALVEWMNQKWLVTEKDSNSTLYTKSRMIQCNYLLKWVTPDKVIHEQWCVVEDGTKYLTGEFEDRMFMTTRGDSRLSVTIARNQYTAALTRENRFVIDDPESAEKLTYLLTKPLKLGSSFTYGENGEYEGVYKFVMQEVTATTFDNMELGIADYYKYFDRDSEDDDDPDDEPEDITGGAGESDTEEDTPVVDPDSGSGGEGGETTRGRVWL